jgi:ubiquinone/menaquinone biosynthesis C-methylase UbiE
MEVFHMNKSRFFTTDDKRMDKVIFPLPSAWWSRPYEYAWAAEFCKPTDVVLDAACGISHPFKFYLAENCKAVHAVDIDDRINDFARMMEEVVTVYGQSLNSSEFEAMSNKINFKQASISELPYKNNMFDKVFCISVLEHLSNENKSKALKEFKRVLKNSGQIVLTIDYPDTTMDLIEDLADEAGLKLAGEKDVIIPQNAICLKDHNLYCFRMVLVKKKEGE